MDPRTGSEIVSRLVKVAFLVRLLALMVAMLGLVGAELTIELLVAVLLLAGTSFAGLAVPRALELVMRHPLLAVSDVALVLAVVVTLGAASPLVLAGLSTALLVGLLYPLHVALLVGGTLTLGYVIAAAGGLDGAAWHGGNGQFGFFLLLGLPATLLCLVGVGQAIRSVDRAERGARAELAEVLRAAATAEERSRVAREIHDTLAKSLQGVAIGAAALPACAGDDEPALEQVRRQARELERGARMAVDQARGLMTQLRTDDPLVGFHQVLREVVESWGARHGGPVAVEAEPVRITAQVRYELLAAVREALENVRRHAPGAAVGVVCERDGGVVRVVVSDRGPGFDVAALTRSEAEGHFGVRGMRERAAAVGGVARVDSVPGAGTRVTFEVPGTGAAPAEPPGSR